MKQLYFMRHGDYDEIGLNDWGKSDVNEAAEKLLTLLEGTSTLGLLSSSQIRAVETAQILRERLSVKYEIFDMVCSDDLCDIFEEEKALSLIESRSNRDACIVVSHQPDIKYLGMKILRKHGISGYSPELPTGGLYLIDLEKGIAEEM